MHEQTIVHYGPDYQLSIVPDRDRKELAVLHKGELVHMPGISDAGDTVTRYRTSHDVTMIMKKMMWITGEIPVTEKVDIS